jgi:hypothetical protein
MPRQPFISDITVNAIDFNWISGFVSTPDGAVLQGL